MTAPITHDPLEAARVLADGGVVAFPTETVYGLGAHAERPEAVARVFAIKGRPAGHPLIVHGADAGVLDRYAGRIPTGARALAEAFWPGPLTLVVPRAAAVPDAVTGGLETVGLRVPDQPLAQAMLAELGAGVAAPSANLFGRTSPTTADHVRDDLGAQVDLILDGGPCAVGVESTILDLAGDEPTILRSGGVSPEAIARVLGRRVVPVASGPSRAPGMLASHYAPQATVILTGLDDLTERLAGLRRTGARTAVIGTSDVHPADPDAIVLHPTGDRPEDFAHDLYRLLREADAAGAVAILVVPPPGEGIAVAVRDRLSRAAHAVGPEGP
jgi:L-threonylcarbamoyladenylate synthase